MAKRRRFKRRRPRQNTCHYHLCRKRTRVFRCKYCGNHFCKEHLRAKLPSMPDFKSTDWKHQQEEREKMDQSRRNYGHPCPAYFDYYKRMHEEKESKYEETLNKLSRTPIKEPEIETGYHGPEYYYKGAVKSKHRKKAVKIIIIGIIIYLIFLGYQSGAIPSFLENITQGLQSSEDRYISTKPNIDTSGLEKDIHDLVNNERRSNRRLALRWDESLASIARAHSKDMSENNFFNHINLRGQEPTNRANAVGYHCRKDFGAYYVEGIAENIFQNPLYDSVTYYNSIASYDWNTQAEIAQSVVSGWMTSEGHRENILSTTYDREGIGVAISGDYVYITENFC